MTTPQEEYEHDAVSGAHTHPHYHSDGSHTHTHTHDAENSHNTTIHHDAAMENPGRTPQEGDGERVTVGNAYGAQMTNKLGPAARAQLRNAQIATHEARRGHER